MTQKFLSFLKLHPLDWGFKRMKFSTPFSQHLIIKQLTLKIPYLFFYFFLILFEKPCNDKRFLG